MATHTNIKKKKPKGETGKRRKAEPAPSHDGAGFKISSIHASTNNNNNNNNNNNEKEAECFFSLFHYVLPCCIVFGGLFPLFFFVVLLYSLNANLVSCRLLSLQNGHC